MRFYLSFLIFITNSLTVKAQCSDTDPGIMVYKENFGGSFNSPANGPQLASAQTPYTFQPTNGIAAGEYGIRKAIQNVSNWVDGWDHTGNNGYMMMVRSSYEKPVFLEKIINNACNTTQQSVCFALASLNRSGSGREVAIRVTITDTVQNNLISGFATPVLKNNDSLVWSNFSFSYNIQASVKTVRIRFSFVSTTPVPDDFAIDDIRVMNYGGGASISSFFININNAPVHQYPFYVCLNSRVYFSTRDLSNSQLVNKMFQWQRMKPDYSFEDIPGATNPYFVIDSAKRDDSRFYKMRISDSGFINNNGCYTVSYPIGLHVDPQPVILTNAPICEGQDLSLSVLEGTTVYWSGPDTFADIGKRVDIPKATAGKSGKYTARVVFTPGCSQTIDTSVIVEVKVNPISLLLPADTILCEGKTLLLNAANSNASYSWSTGDTTASILVKKEDIYNVMVYKEGCNKRSFINVHALGRPLAFLRKDTSICIGDTLLLNGSQTNATGFHWSTGDTTQQIIVTKKGNYSLRAGNFCGTNTAYVNINFERCYDELLLPTAFTPNRDGLNDIFKPVNDISVKQYSMKVYSRWGQVIFTSNDMRKGWDGMVNRSEQPTGVYVWEIAYTGKTGVKHTIHGTVMLIK